MFGLGAMDDCSVRTSDASPWPEGFGAKAFRGEVASFWKKIFDNFETALFLSRSIHIFERGFIESYESPLPSLASTEMGNIRSCHSRLKFGQARPRSTEKRLAFSLLLRLQPICDLSM